MAKDALLVVDVQHGFINSHTKHIPKKIEKLLPKYSHVFCTKFYNPQDSFYRTLIHWNEMSKSCDDFKLAYRPTANAIVLEKVLYTCVDEKFINILNDQNIKEVHICGIDTDNCVLKCAVDLIENGFIPKVLVSYCGSSAGEKFHNFSIKILERFIGKEQIVSGDL